MSGKRAAERPGWYVRCHIKPAGCRHVRQLPILDGHQGYVGERINPDVEIACTGKQALDTVNTKWRKAESAPAAAKEDLKAALTGSHQPDRLCNAQLQEFETHVIPEGRDISKTDFDLEQHAQKIECTRELI